MKKAILFLSSILILLFISTNCSKSDDTDVSNNSGAQNTETSFNFTMTSFKKQEVVSSAQGKQTSFTADQIMTGHLTATNTDTLVEETFDWSIYFDESTWTVQSNKTIILAPGTYDFALLLTEGDQQYAGSVAGQSISDGTFDVAMTIRPIIGDTLTNVTLVASLADFKFQFDPAELGTAGFVAPQLGVILDGGTEATFGLNPATGISDNYINLSEGSHNIQLKLYDGSLQKGRSITAQEDIVVSPGLNIAMDLVALHGETTFALTEAGGDATFAFTIPAEVVTEAGGLSNLKVDFLMSGSNNPLDGGVLSLAQDGDNYAAQMTLNDKQYDDVTISLTFTDIADDEILGSCAQTTVLDTTERTITCDLTLRRRAVIGGSLLATLGINALNEAGEPVSGAVVFQDGEELGITGNGTFGTDGYLKVLLIAGDYTIRAEAIDKYGIVSGSLSALSSSNRDIILDQDIVPESSSRLPDTGQTTCYSASASITCPSPGEAFYGQDANYSINPPSYTDNGGGTVTDNVTGLVWQKSDDDTPRNWWDAITYCSVLELGGKTDWRLPDVKELAGITDLERFSPVINPIFTGTDATDYWSSTISAINSDLATSVDFNAGYIPSLLKYATYYVRCVRGGQ